MATLLERIARGCLCGWSRVAPSEKGSFRLVRAARRLMPRDHWLGRFRLPGGLRMDLDLATYPDCCMAFGLYELTTARLIRRLLREGDHFVDGGSNIGYFTMLAAHCVGESGRVDAFEPEPHNRKRLLDHLELNNLDDRVRVHPVALADAAGEATIHFPELNEHVNHGCSSLFARPGEKTIDTRVDTVRLDEVLAGTRPTLIKFDLEGAEPMAIEGARGLLVGEYPPAIVGEFNPAQADIAGVESNDWVQRALRIQPRYTAGRIGLRLSPLDTARLLEGEAHQCNLLLWVK